MLLQVLADLQLNVRRKDLRAPKNRYTLPVHTTVKKGNNRTTKNKTSSKHQQQKVPRPRLEKGRLCAGCWTVHYRLKHPSLSALHEKSAGSLNKFLGPTHCWMDL